MTRTRVTSWITWFGILVLATIVLRATREDLDTVHVVLTYLLIVLGGSVSGGRTLALAITVACVAFIDYFFQLPYDALSVTKPLDMVVLLAFLTTATVATHLLARERARAAEAELRASEVASLGRLGAEVLSTGRAEETLAHIAEVVRTSLDMTECRIYGWEEGAIRLRAASPERRAVGAPAAPNPQALAALIERTDHRVDEPTDTPALETSGDDPRALVLVLRAHQRTVGVLWLATLAPATLDTAERRFVGALAYYAALAVERAHLVTAAEHADALREANRLKDVVLASVSHDLRTPLTTIKALAQRARRGGDPYALEIEEQADRLGHLVADLLDLSRLKTGALSLHTDLNTAEDLVGAALRQIDGIAAGRAIETHVDLVEPALVGRFDFVQSLRILTNLLENALRYAPPPCADRAAGAPQWGVPRLRRRGSRPGGSCVGAGADFRGLLPPAGRPGGRGRSGTRPRDRSRARGAPRRKRELHPPPGRGQRVRVPAAGE